MEPTTDRSTDMAPGKRGRQVATAILAVVVAVLGVFILTDGNDDGIDDGDEVATDGTTTTIDGSTSEAPSTTAAISTTVRGDGALTDAERAMVVWPDPDGDAFDDPVDAATSFAEDLAGFTNPIVGDFQQGDTRSGEVEIRAANNGPITTVLVRTLGGDGAWYVIGATTPEIELDEPEARDEISSPADLRGRARAFEGNVQVAVFARGSTDPIGEGFVTGSGGGELGPFEGEIEFDDPPAGVTAGVLLLHVDSARDGSVWQVFAVPVQFD